MRKFRNAALAAATATAVAFGGTVVADAQESDNGAPTAFISGSSTKNKNNTPLRDVFKEGHEAFKNGQGFWGYGNALGADDEAYLTYLLGKEKNDAETPQWALMWRDAIDWLLLATGLGLTIGAGNWALNNGLLPQVDWNQFQ